MGVDSLAKPRRFGRYDLPRILYENPHVCWYICFWYITNTITKIVDLHVGHLGVITTSSSTPWVLVASTANAMASSKASKISTSGRPRCADGLTTWGPYRNVWPYIK